MRNNLFKLAFVAMLCASLLSSCTSDLEMPPPPDNPISSSAQVWSYCVYPEIQGCYPGSYSTCPAGGVLRNDCPYSNSNPVQSSSSGSGSIADNSSSSLTLPSSTGSVVKSSSSQGTGQIEDYVFTDSRDGKKYKFEIYEGQIWMSENLNYSRGNTLGYCYGVDIDGANPHRDSISCGYSYGRVYEWSVAMDGKPPQGLCPDGWHIPSAMEWTAIGAGTASSTAGTRKMSNAFYIYSGNYDYFGGYEDRAPGWYDIGKSGLYWTNDNKNNLVIMGTNYFFLKNDAAPIEYFSVRCIANDDFKPSCGVGQYAPATQFCYNGTPYALCGGSTYNPSTHFCSGTTSYALCGGKTYDPATEFCLGTLVYDKCGGRTYDPATRECINGALQNYRIVCNGDHITSNMCNKNSQSVQNDDCIDLEINWTNTYYNPPVIMTCRGGFDSYFTSNASISIKVGNNPAVTVTGSGGYVSNKVTLIPQIKFGPIEVLNICVSFDQSILNVSCIVEDS